MSPFFRDGEEIHVKQNYYNCHSLKRDDIVIVDTYSHYWQILKQVKALPGDKIRMDFDKWSIFINNEQLFSPHGQYVFTKSELDMMNLYLKEDTLIENAYFVFGTQLQNSIDSRKLGGISFENIIWKIDRDIIQ